jgi:isoquinoline 1-oxidoreductase subunit beta
MNIQRNKIVDDVASTDVSLSMAHSPVVIQTWPAAGGGLQVCTSLPTFGNHPAAARQSHPNVFIRVGWDSSIRISVPYVLLEESGAAHIAYIVAEELDLQLDRIHVEGGLNGHPQDREEAASTVSDFDIEFAAGDYLRAAAAVIHAMLIAAAAEIWGVPRGECHSWNGLVVHTPTNRHLHYGALSSNAALQRFPRRATLRNGRHFVINRS